ncbi:b, exonuclease domain protein, DNA polymerase family, partial [Ancylostoma caninum]
GTAERDAWLINFQPAELIEEQTKAIISAVDFYFIQGNGERFKISYPFRPYFYISTSDGAEHQVASFLTKKYGGFLVVDIMDKEDLDLKNHLSGLKKTYLKLSFPSTSELAKVKRDLMPHIRKNKERVKKESQYCSYLARNMGGSKYDIQNGDVFSDILDIREYDLPYHMRVAIDEKYFVGKWYTVRGISSTRKPSIVSHPTLIDPIDPVVLAFDIETTKLPLKFPDSSTDEIMMISYMIDGKGFLIINRDIVSADIESFEYTPKEEYKGKFFIFNEPDETATIKRFFDHILEVRPNVIVTYNGDFFDWPFVETRARIRGINMEDEIGFAKDSADEFKSRNCIHMDAFRWVKRDSYLPVGSQNLKAVAKAKLRYDPVEVDPEDMCKMAREDPQSLANYSVSDAVATYYLYMKYVHPFVFALCTIIPLGPDDLEYWFFARGLVHYVKHFLWLRPFTTISYSQINLPVMVRRNRRRTDTGKFLIESETYVGGHVEALEAGVFRADIPCKFRLAPAALKSLRDSVPETIEKELIREFGIPLENVVDFEERCAEVQETFDNLLAIPARMENPRIYHLDVGAMYPNIILTNRLQPCAMVNEETCMACTYNRPDAKCKRVMNWEWRGELTPATRGELQQIIQQLEGETFGKPPKAFHQLERAERQSIEKKRVQDYCRRVYGRTHLTRLEMRQTMICQRENAFYVDTVKAFRDRRYEYKELLKKAKGSLDEISKDDIAGIKAAQGRVVLYESLQLAHKCILNSFYGYVMRKGSRWFSMEMAGIVCHTGANIITEARKLVEQIGKPLELDTDGIWCLLPASFPENITFKLQNHKRKSITVSYPGAMLNAVVNAGFTNDQYHNLQPDGSYTISKENSIFFEVDGPYQCMVLPASKEEGKKLKKRYADAGLACKFVISRHPLGSPVTERAVPIAIFLAEDKVRLHYLKQWTKQPALTMEKTNIRELLDWDYYIERLGSCIQKIITIPAALQGLPNPVPRIAHPDWLDNKIKNR